MYILKVELFLNNDLGRAWTDVDVNYVEVYPNVSRVTEVYHDRIRPEYSLSLAVPN
jgi:hypothetical protein